ncbi:MAG: histone H1 [Ignavibacterium sp.]|uniref:histone H1 n=1 Tax=Ignavibacterium sp. TaxID=2651167 RepID=UPI00404945B1
MDQYQKLVDFVKSLEPDFRKFYEKGQSAAGTRVRKGLSELKKLCQEIRNNVQEVKAQRKAQREAQKNP